MGNLKHCTKGSNVAKHARTFNHVIDFNNSKIIDKVNNRSRKTLETWHTAKTIRADNNSCQLSRQYHILLKKRLFSSPFSTFFYHLLLSSNLCKLFVIYIFFSFLFFTRFCPLKTAVQSVESSKSF